MQSDKINNAKHLFESYIEGNKEAYNSLLVKSIKYLKELNSEINSNSIYLNSYDFVNIDEPKNSKILADLINPLGSHGQGTLFLKFFLKIIGVSYSEKDIWQVFAEKNNIDIFLYANSPNRIIIIENKVYNAVDQLNQLYRYYELKIKSPYKSSVIDKSNFKIIYLTKTNEKTISTHSTKSLDKKDEVPSELINFWTFDKEIKEIFDKAKPYIPDNNYRLKAHLDFYLEHSLNN
jgi:hypothetical protein